MRKLRFEIEVDLDELPAQERADLLHNLGGADSELGTIADIDIKELGGMIACSIGWAENAKEAEFWAGSDMFGKFAGVKLVGVRDMGAIAADPRSAWGTCEAHRNTLAALKALLAAKQHGNGLEAWNKITEAAERAIEQSEALLPKATP